VGLFQPPPLPAVGCLLAQYLHPAAALLLKHGLVDAVGQTGGSGQFAQSEQIPNESPYLDVVLSEQGVGEAGDFLGYLVVGLLQLLGPVGLDEFEGGWGGRWLGGLATVLIGQVLGSLLGRPEQFGGGGEDEELGLELDELQMGLESIPVAGAGEKDVCLELLGAAVHAQYLYLEQLVCLAGGGCDQLILE